MQIAKVARWRTALTFLGLAKNLLRCFGEAHLCKINLSPLGTCVEMMTAAIWPLAQRAHEGVTFAGSILLVLGTSGVRPTYNGLLLPSTDRSLASSSIGPFSAPRVTKSVPVNSRVPSPCFSYVGMTTVKI